MQARKQFTFYTSYYDAIALLKPRQRLAALEAVILYALKGKEPENLGRDAQVAFLLVKPTLEASWKKSQAKTKKKDSSRSADHGFAHEGEKENEVEKEVENELEKEKELEVEMETYISAGAGMCGFDIFWNLFPVKLGMAEARTEWGRLNVPPEQVIKGLKRWLGCRRWQLEGGQYIPRAAKFLRERYFEQEPEVPGVIYGCSGELGQAELDSIEALMHNG